MNNTLEKLTTTLENYVECNKTLNRIECLDNDLNNKNKLAGQLTKPHDSLRKSMVLIGNPGQLAI